MDRYHIAFVFIILFLFHRRIHRRILRYLQPDLLVQSSNDPPINGSTAESSAPRGVRLNQVYPPPGDDTETDIDIIAIHGLDTRSEDTWVWKPKSESVNWLFDKDMLPFQVTLARIFMCDWLSDLFEDSNYIQKTFDEFARLLLASIAARPRSANSSEHKDRPILFIASCLGGNIFIKALVGARSEYRSVLEAVRGIVFLATPFSGTSFRDVAEWALPGLKTWAFIRLKRFPTCYLLSD